MANPKVKACILHAGCDLVGSVRSFRAGRTKTMEATPIGVLMVSSETKRTILIPYSNIQGMELVQEKDEQK